MKAIPTVQGGTHVNGLRQGLLMPHDWMYEFRNKLPRGVKLTADDIWDRCAYILSLKMQDAQFAGQTKERFIFRQSAVFVAGLKDAFQFMVKSKRTRCGSLITNRSCSTVVNWRVRITKFRKNRIILSRG